MHLRGPNFADLRVTLLRDDKGAFRIANEEDQITLDFPVYRILRQKPISREKIIEEVKNGGNGVGNLSNSTVDRQLKQLVAKGWIERVGHGLYRRRSTLISDILSDVG